jgi:hypothetical protein
MTVAFVAGSNAHGTYSSNIPAGGSFSTAYTTPAGTNCLVVADSNSAGTLGPPSSVTYGGYPLALVPGSVNSPFIYGNTVSLWYLLNPPTGTSLNVVAVYPNGTGSGGLQMLGLSGVDQVNPVNRAFIASNNGSGSGSTSFSLPAQSTYTGALNVGFANAYIQTTTPTITSGSNQTNETNYVARGTSVIVEDIANANVLNAFTWTATTAVAWAGTTTSFLPVQVGPFYYSLSSIEEF